MKRLKRSECSILPLVLKRRWFEMVALGQKKEEYRDCSDYWKTWFENWFARSNFGALPMVVEFRLGYAARAQRTAFLLNSFLIRAAYRFEHPDWGEPQGQHYVLRLGERVALEGGE